MKAMSVVAVVPSLTFALFALTDVGRASEPRGDLEVVARHVETVPAGAGDRAFARIEVVLEVFRGLRDPVLTVERPDGTPWRIADREVRPRESAWTDLAGTVVVPGPGGLDIPPRSALRTRIEVPLEGRAVHEIVVRATGAVGETAISATAVVRVPLGVSPVLPVDDGTYAHYTLAEVN